MAVTDSLGASSPKDLACAAEPIHTPGTIQPHGVLLAADPAQDFRLVAASLSAVALPGAGPHPLARTLPELLGGAFATALAERSRAGALLPASPWETTLTLGLPPRTFDVTAHAHAGTVIVELEPADPGDAASALDAARHLQRAIAALRASEGGLEDLAGTAVRALRLLTGYERVLVYRFDADWNGQAIAEDRAPGWDHSLLHLHFPASDIPSQARALYHRSTMRWVADRDATPVPLVAAPGVDRIDLSFARLRSLSPTHLQYHRNLGVDGTMSISIMAGQRLWGLMVCHHRRPHRTSAGQRAAAAALTDAFALRVGPAEQAGHEADRQGEQGRFSALIAHMAQVDDLQAALTAGPVTVRDLFAVPGAAVVQGGEATLLGATPRLPDVLRLADWLRAGPLAPGPGLDSGVFATTTLPAQMPGWTEAAAASGLLAVSLAGDRADLLMWFRPEEPQTVTWGGNPVRDTAEIGPRQSFDRWVEERRGTARPWAPHELEIAKLLRHAITEVINRSLRRIAALHEQLRQSQKMEAVGQLTGGLAHDFNNLLAGITGSLELAQVRLAQGRGGELGRYLGTALAATGRAASLTHRLLAFSRRQTLDPRPTDVNKLVHGMEELIRRTMGPSITVECVGGAGLWTVLCDANQLENALLNLALNARDAMKDGGRLTIEAANTRLDDAYAGKFDVPPGHYVAVSVSDTGEGMTPDTAARVFEPFFTTKPMGQGTGLGLSMVYGFTKQSGGHARIYSEVGHGTTVRLYLPRHHGPAVSDDAPATTPQPRPATSATVLVVDDEPVLRMLVGEVLREQGFAVLEASNGAQALAVLDTAASVDLLLTDVGLPGGMNGRQVVDAARTARPGLKVLFMTGFAENAALSGGVLDPVTQVLTKPFGMGALVGKVRGMLG